MELDELKQKWTEYDNKLNESLKFNENLLRKMNLDKSREKIQKPIILEIINIGIQFPVVIFLSYSIIHLFDKPEFSITGFIALMILLYSVISSVIKIKVFTNIDYYNSPITMLQKQLTILKLKFLNYQKVILISLPVLVASIVPIVFYSFAGINVYEKLYVFFIVVTIYLVFGYFVAFWVNRSLDRKLKDSEMYLKEIENFKMEK